MGASASRSSLQTNQTNLHQSKEDELPEVLHARCSIINDSECGSFVFIVREGSGSISSAEDVLLTDNIDCSPTNEPQRDDTEGFQEVPQAETIRCPSEEHTNPQQDLARVNGGVAIRGESDPINITSNPCSAVEEFPDRQTPNTEILPRSSIDNFIPTEDSVGGKEEWIQISACDSTLYNIYDIFSAYGSVSALAQTKDHIYVKFSSWAGVTNVFADIKNVKEVHKISSLKKVEDNELKTHPDRKEIYLDLPSFVVAYLKEHRELSKALNVIAITAIDNMCLNAPKIQQVLEHIRRNVGKGFQHCSILPFGCHVLGSCDRYAPLEIFIDVGDMYAGCHKQSTEEQTAIAKEVRTMISDDVIWCSDEESPVGVFFHETVGLTCILNFNNGFGDRCTRLLGVFMEYDDRFRILYLMLEIWSKQCSLQGLSNGLNSYIVAVLLVFYLQAIPVPLLPPIHQIRSSRPVVIKGWDCSFVESASLLPRNECSTELHSLLRGFFVFYGSFDWKRVVCPVLGHSVDRAVFASPSLPFPDDPIIANYYRALSEQVPNTPQLDISTSMCVQDFFNLSENVAKGVSPEMLLRFQSLCRQSHKMIYTAESKMSFGSRKTHHIPYNPYDKHTRHDLANEFGHRGKFGSVNDCTTSLRSWERSSNLDYFEENEVHCIRTKCTGTSGRKNSRENCQRKRFNRYDDMSRQPKGSPNARGGKIQQSGQCSRSFQARVFWQNGQKNRQD